jgi:hypothetical protein
MAARAERLEEGFQTVYLTLFSMVIALVLEKLIDRVGALTGLWPLDDQALLVWLQAGSLFLTALLMWLMVSYLVLALRFDFKLVDAAVPFFLIVLCSVVIASIGERNGLPFFYLAAVGQGTGLINFPRFMRMAARYAENAVILRHSDYGLFLGLGVASAVVPLAAALMLQAGWMGLRGAVWGTGLLALITVGLILSFSSSWWRSIQAASREDEGEAMIATGSA